MITLMGVDECMKMFASLGIFTFAVPYISVWKLCKCVCVGGCGGGGGGGNGGFRRAALGSLGSVVSRRPSGYNQTVPTWLKSPVVTWVISPKRSPRHLGELLQIGISLSRQTFFGGSISWLWVLCWVVGHLTRRRWSSIVVSLGWMCSARRPALHSWMRSLIAWGQPGRPGKTRFFKIDARISLSRYMDLS